jgi:hypothetical protein
VTGIVRLIGSPGALAHAALERGRPWMAAVAVGAATLLAAADVARAAADVSVQDVMFGPDRTPLIDALVSHLGRDLTAVVLHLLEESWTAVLVVSALGPVWMWLLGASAIHAAARLAGDGRSFRPILPMLVLVGIATGLTRGVAELVALAAGPRGAGSGLAEVVGFASLVWLGAVSFRGIERHYGVAEPRAAVILVLAIGLFYLVPLALILLAVIAILVAAVALDYFPVG